MDKEAIAVIKEFGSVYSRDYEINVKSYLSPRDFIKQETARLWSLIPENVSIAHGGVFLDIGKERSAYICSISKFVVKLGVSFNFSLFNFVQDTDVADVVFPDILSYRPSDMHGVDRRFVMAARRRVARCFGRIGSNVHLRYKSGIRDWDEKIDLIQKNVFAVLGLRGGMTWYLSVIEMPEVKRNEVGQIHAIGEPAVNFKDGFSSWAIRGVRTRKHLKKGITGSYILRARNSEERRVLIEEVGWDRFCELLDPRHIHTDGYGSLYEFPQFSRESELPRYVKLVNSTQEPDGTYKDYILRVPPWVETAEGACAWLAGFGEENLSKYGKGIVVET